MHTPDPTEVRAEPWLEDVFQRTHDGILVLDRRGTLLCANRAFLAFCGRTEDQVAGRALLEFVPPPQRKAWQRDLDKLLAGDWTSLQRSLAGADGREVPFHITLISHSTHRGRPAAIIHLHDASVYHTVERAMVAAQSQWARSFDAIADCMCLLDRGGQILRANEAMAGRFRPRYDNLVGADYRAVLDLPAGHGLPDAVREAPFTAADVEWPAQGGWFTISSFPLKDDSDAVTGAVLILRDITAQHAVAENLKRIEGIHHQASKMEAVGRLAGGIAHDFNNLLTSVLGYSSLMLRTTPPEDPRHKDIREIVAAAERGASLTRQLLDFSRPKAVNTHSVALNSVIRNLEQFLARTLGENIKLTLRLAPDLAGVAADESRIEQVIVNLAINARDAMGGSGQLVIETDALTLDAPFCTSHPPLKPGRYAVLQVSDTGCGMPPEVLDRVFEPFFTTKTRDRGTGLGLSTIYGVVKQYGGHISVYSEVGRGTTFKLYFPEAGAPAAAPAPARDALRSRLPRGHETVLVVDDEPNIVGIAGQILTAMGYHVLAADDSRRALALADRHSGSIDLVLTDVVMPALNGKDLVEALRRSRPALKALYMSGYASRAAIQMGALDAGMDFLQKPFNSDTLTRRVRAVLDGAAPAREAGPAHPPPPPPKETHP